MTLTTSTTVFEPVSLGYACDVKYQVSRNLYFRIHPDHSETEFRNVLFRWGGRPSIFRRHIFDWAITPYPAVCAYLEDDFHGVFEREDLEIGGDGNVHHRRLRTIHPHDFSKGADGRVSAETLDAEYPAVRSKFDHLAQRFRHHLKTPGRYLYVMSEIRPFAEVQRLADLLSAPSPEHDFHLLFVAKEGAVNQVLHGLKASASKGWLPATPPDKPADRVWEGTDQAWDRILDRYHLALPGVVAAPPTRPDAQISTNPQAVAVAGPADGVWTTLATAEGAFLGDGFDYVGDRGAILANDDGLRFEGAGADDHIFSHFLPTPPSPAGAWLRMRVTWPMHGPRAVLIVQDQECRTPPLALSADGPCEELRLGLLGPDVDHVRCVFLPVAGAGRLPIRISVEAQAAPSQGAPPPA